MRMICTRADSKGTVRDYIWDTESGEEIDNPDVTVEFQKFMDRVKPRPIVVDIPPFGSPAN